MSTYIPPHKRNQMPPATNQKPDRVTNVSDAELKNRPNTMASRLAALKATESHIEIWAESKKEKVQEKRKVPIIVEKKDEELDEDEYIPLKAADDGWTVVEKKVRTKRDRIQEALDNGDAPLSDEEEEQSYWDDQPEEYETYWDRKP